MFVTTIRKNGELLSEKAQKIADELNIAYVPRQKYGLDKLKQSVNSDYAIVVHQDKLTIDLGSTELFFHPNMAQVRVKRLRSGGDDNMLMAMAVRPGMSVLDCTLGFGADAIVSSFGVGKAGKVVGLEANPFLAYIVKNGLKTYRATNQDLESAMRRIEVINEDYEDYLKKLPDNAFDIVYFDPMFQHPLLASENLSPLRLLAKTDSLQSTALEEAKRVAKYRVIFKENSRSKMFAQLGFTDIKGGKYAPIAYGVWEKKSN